MATVKEVRASIDHTLDRWQAAASSLEANAQATTAQVSERLQTFKDKAAAASEKLKQAVASAQQLPSEARDKITADIDHLKVQLALGKAEAHDAVIAQKQKIGDAVQRVEQQIDQYDKQLDDAMNAAIADLVRAEMALDHELELAEMRFEHEKQQRHAQSEAKKQELIDNAKQFRATLEEKAAAAQQKGSTFASDMKASFEQVKAAFSKLGN